MSKGLSDPNEYVNVLAARRSEGTSLTPKEREEIIQEIIASQYIEGIEMSYETVAEIVDEVLAEPVAPLK